MFDYELELVKWDGDITEDIAQVTVRRYFFWFESSGDFYFEYKGKRYMGVPQRDNAGVYTGKVNLYEAPTYPSRKIGAVYTTH